MTKGMLLYLGIALLSSASLTLQVTLTRILSVAQGYHFAFLIVSTALLGIGASGTYLMCRSARRGGEPSHAPSPRLLVTGPVLFSATAVAAYLALNRLPFDIVRLAWEPRQLGWLALAYGILAVPFFFSGLTIAAALMRVARVGRAGRVYGADLLGAATGAWLPVVLYPVPMIGATGAVLLSGALGLVAAALIWMSGAVERVPPSIIVPAGLSILLLGVGVIAPSWYEIRLSPYKGLMTALRYPEAQHLSTRWNLLSRVDVVKSPAVRFAPGLSLTYAGALPPQIGFTVDGDQLHAITASHDDRAGLDFLRYLPSAAPYHVATPRAVLVIEPGGGLDVLMALYFRANSVEVVERNPALLAVVRQPAPEFTSRIYDDPRVKVHLTHPRSFLSGTGVESATYDLIVLSPLHALGASAFGLHGFAEDYSLTREAIAQYYRHLAPDGWLVLTRYLQPFPLHDLRVAATLIETLEGLGIPDPGHRLAVLRTWGTITLIVKRGVLSPHEIQRLKVFAESLRFDLEYYPGVMPHEVNRFNRFAQPIYYRFLNELLDPDTRGRLYRDYPFEIRPVTDDRPFFGYVLKVSTLNQTYHLVREKWLFLIEGGLLLPVMLLQALVLAAVFILIPTAWASARVATPSVLAYFFLIAFAFMGVEIAMIQRLVLFLGHPVYAISAVLATLLLFAGLGSLLTSSRRVREARRRHLILLVLGVAVIGEGLALPSVLSPLMGLPIEVRFVLASVFLAPLGLLMGMPLPLGIQALQGSGRQALIPWAWAVNGSTSVVAAILTVMVAMEIGFTGVFVGAGIGYAFAGLLLSD